MKNNFDTDRYVITKGLSNKELKVIKKECRKGFMFKSYLN